MTENTETAILAGGCFWPAQELLRHRDGVISTRVGYTGGENDNPTADNHPGHAEAVEVIFDPERTSYRDILEFFFQIHRPDLGDGRCRLRLPLRDLLYERPAVSRRSAPPPPPLQTVRPARATTAARVPTPGHSPGMAWDVPIDVKCGFG